MRQTLPTEELEHNGETHRISFRWAVECKQCGHITSSASNADRITCGNCNRKNSRDQILGKYYEEYIKHTLFTGDEENVNQVTELLSQKAALFEAMQENGWSLDCTTRSSHVALSKGDVPPQEIHA